MASVNVAAAKKVAVSGYPNFHGACALLGTGAMLLLTICLGCRVRHNQVCGLNRRSDDDIRGARAATAGSKERLVSIIEIGVDLAHKIDAGDVDGAARVDRPQQGVEVHVGDGAARRPGCAVDLAPRIGGETAVRRQPDRPYLRAIGDRVIKPPAAHREAAALLAFERGNAVRAAAAPSKSLEKTT